jgi:hypothetical protein
LAASTGSSLIAPRRRSAAPLGQEQHRRVVERLQRRLSGAVTISQMRVTSSSAPKAVKPQRHQRRRGVLASSAGMPRTAGAPARGVRQNLHIDAAALPNAMPEGVVFAISPLPARNRRPLLP